MEQVLNDVAVILGAITTICGAIILIAQRIPGDQPEKFLQSVVDFIAKFSKK